jgi:hypothetical protein
MVVSSPAMAIGLNTHASRWIDTWRWEAQRCARPSRNAKTVARATGGQPESVADLAAKDAATGRFTQPQEVADLVLLLAIGRGGNVTGANVVIDGGLTTTLWGRRRVWRCHRFGLCYRQRSTDRACAGARSITSDARLESPTVVVTAKARSWRRDVSVWANQAHRRQRLGRDSPASARPRARAG